MIILNPTFLVVVQLVAPRFNFSQKPLICPIDQQVGPPRVVSPVIQDQIPKHGFENNWWNELDQLSRRLDGLAAMCPKVLSQADTRREPIVKQFKQLCPRFADG